MNRQQCIRVIFKVFAITVLSFCCWLQLRTSLDKFVSSKTTTAQFRRPQSHATLPMVVICPHNLYRLAAMDAFNMTVFIPHLSKFDKWPDSEGKVEEAWLSTTFDFKDLVRSIYAKVNGAQCELDTKSGKCKCFLRDKDTKAEIAPEACYINVSTLDTLYNGRCFAVQLTHDVTTQENLYIVFHHQKEQESGPPMAFIGAKSHLMSIASMFWEENPFSVKPRQHEEINVIARPEEDINHGNQEEACLADITVDDFDQCVRLQTEANMYDLTVARAYCESGKPTDAFGNCTIPQASYFAPKREERPYCADEVSAGCAHIIVKETLRQLVGGKFPGCLRPCSRPKYQTSQFSLSMWPPRVANTSRLFLYLASTDVTLMEEYCLFDLNVIVSSVGGSLGLFLGFSFYQVLTFLLAFIRLD